MEKIFLSALTKGRVEGDLKAIQKFLDEAGVEYKRFLDRVIPKIQRIIKEDSEEVINLHEEALWVLKDKVEEETGIYLKGVILDTITQEFIIPKGVKRRLQEMDDIPAVEAFLNNERKELDEDYMPNF